MESLEEYISRVSKENKIVINEEDPLCALHTILKKFEEDLLFSQKVLLQQAAVEFRKIHEELQEKYDEWDKDYKDRIEKIMNATFSKSDATLNECLLSLNKNSEEEQKNTKQLIHDTINEAVAASVPRISSPLKDPLVRALIGSNMILGTGYILFLFL